MQPTEREAIIDAVLGRLSKVTTLGLVRDEVPLGVRIQANAPGGSATTIIIAPNNPGDYEIAGVRSFNRPETIEILRLSNGDADIAQNMSAFDSATYSLEYRTDQDPDLDKVKAFFPVKWGTISNRSPMLLTFAAIGNPSEMPFINWTLFGRHTAKIDLGSHPPRSLLAQLVDQEMGQDGGAQRPNHPWVIR